MATPHGLVEGVNEVKLEIQKHFEMFFKESNLIRLTPEGILLSTLEEADRNRLEELFIEEEVRDAVWSCDGDKSSRMDGFTL